MVTRWLADIGALDPGVVIKNGSGLFDANRVTAATTVQLLRAAWRDPAIRESTWRSSRSAASTAPCAAASRKRRSAAPSAPRRAPSTTPSPSAATCWGRPGKGPIVFSVLFNKIEGKAYGARSAADKLVELVANRLWGESDGAGEKTGRVAGGSR